MLVYSLIVHMKAVSCVGFGWLTLPHTVLATCTAQVAVRVAVRQLNELELPLAARTVRGSHTHIMLA